MKAEPEIKPTKSASKAYVLHFRLHLWFNYSRAFADRHQMSTEDQYKPAYLISANKTRLIWRTVYYFKTYNHVRFRQK
jgi:hypothetical protein